MRCRKAQMELCLALERRNSAYLLENSRSPSCLLRSGPAESSCLKPPKTAHTFHFVKSIFRALYFIYSPEIKNPPESGLQKSVKRVQQWGVHVSDARQETSHLIFISEDIKKRTFYSKTDQKTRTLMLTAWFTWQEVMKPNRRGSPAGLPGRTASCRRLRWRVSETRQQILSRRRTTSGSVALQWKQNETHLHRSWSQVSRPPFVPPRLSTPPANFMILII